MRLLANENIPGPLVVALRERGHEVAWIVEDARGAQDAPIITRAASEGRTLLTCDLGFGELAFKHRLAGRDGVILLRIPATSLEAFVSIAVAAICSREDWPDRFSVVEPGRIRMTPLPRPKP